MCRFIETIRIEQEQAFNLDYHTERLNRTRAVFWRDAPTIDLKHCIAPPAFEGTQKCRIVYGQEIEEITYTPYQMRNVQTLKLTVCNDITYPFKQLNRDALNLLFAQRGDADDALIVKDGYLTDTSIANIALRHDNGCWFTPVHPLLRGTKRAELLDKNKIRERDIHATELGKYSHIMLFNAMIDWEKIVIPISDHTLFY